MSVVRVGLDIAKSVFQLHGVDAHGKAVLAKRLSRSEVLTYFSNLSPCLVGIEACGALVRQCRGGCAGRKECPNHLGDANAWHRVPGSLRQYGM